MIGRVETDAPLDDVVEVWLRYQTRSDEADDTDWWAVEYLYEVDDEAERRALIAALVERAATDEQLANVAAGPLEGFIVDDPSRLHWIERQASRSERFRRALRMVWVGGTWSVHGHERFRRAAGFGEGEDLEVPPDTVK
jgi:hypothetical protein